MKPGFSITAPTVRPIPAQGIALIVIHIAHRVESRGNKFLLLFQCRRNHLISSDFAMAISSLLPVIRA